jgi:tRNA threonylcarbamoyladenosine biosynthesis protein TsaB
MLILTVRTDKPEAELGLYIDEKQLAYPVWSAHRQLAETIHAKIKAMLAEQSLNLQELQGVVIYKGPGSFTGLRIGFSVANALADSLSIPIISANGDDWIAQGIHDLQAGKNEVQVLPDYGAPAKTTKQKK